jgi:hypothetical protein
MQNDCLFVDKRNSTSSFRLSIACSYKKRGCCCHSRVVLSQQRYSSSSSSCYRVAGSTTHSNADIIPAVDKQFKTWLAIVRIHQEVAAQESCLESSQKCIFQVGLCFQFVEAGTKRLDEFVPPFYSALACKNVWSRFNSRQTGWAQGHKFHTTDLLQMTKIMNRSVKFMESDSVHEIPHVDDLSKEEVSMIWFTTQEYQMMIAEDNMILQAMMIGKNIDTFFTRGLKGRTPVGSMSRRISTVDSVCLVMAEQDRQTDPEKMAAIYIGVTANCRKEAYERGMTDAEYSDKVEGKTNKKCRKCSVRSSNDLILLKKGRGAVSRFQRFIDRATTRR